MGKNLKKIQGMLDGQGTGKIVVGDHSIKSSETRSVGDRWTDSDGVEWEQKEGYRSQVSRMGKVGMFSKQCKDCDKVIAGNNMHPLDWVLWKKQQRCFHCQIDYEAMLKTKGKWRFWVRLQQLSNMDAIERDLEESIFEAHEQKQEKVWDKTVANALANSEVDLTIGKNKNS